MNPTVGKKLDKFFSQYKSRKYKKHELLIRSGDKPIGLYFLKDGMVRQYAITAGGEELTLNIFKPGSFFPMSWIMNDVNSTQYYEAMIASTLKIAPKKEALVFLKGEPEVLFDLVKRIYIGLEGFFLRLEESMLGSARTRLIAELLIYAMRFGIKQGKHIIVNLQLTEKDIAAQSGIARETVSRQLRKLREDGSIDFRRNTLTIKNIKQLEEALSFA